jgi:hypothetical protein
MKSTHTPNRRNPLTRQLLYSQTEVRGEKMNEVDFNGQRQSQSRHILGDMSIFKKKNSDYGNCLHDFSICGRKKNVKNFTIHFNNSGRKLKFPK